MAGVVATSTSPEEVAAQNAQQNDFTLLHTLFDWVQLGNALSSANKPTYALQSNYKFTLPNSSGYIDRFRIWIQDLDINVATAAASLNRGGFAALLGLLEVKLGNHIYRVKSTAVDLLAQTFSRQGRNPRYSGAHQGGATPAYSYLLSGSANGSTSSESFQTALGDNIWNGYLEIPMAMLEMVGDSEGIAPTLSQAPFEVSWTTPASLQSADAYEAPIQSGGTAVVTLGTTTTSAISVWAHMAKLRTVFSNQALPAFVVGSGFRFEEVSVPFLQSPSFYTFQGQSGFNTLVKSIAVIDNPGELAGEFSNAPTNLLQWDLMYDRDNDAYTSSAKNNPTSVYNWLVDQRRAIGDQPPGVFVFDWSRGTNADYPNSHGYLDLTTFRNAGVYATYNVAPASTATIKFLNVYLDDKLYTAQG